MMIYPKLQILNGGCVVLEQGCLDDPVMWHSDPIACVRDFSASGARWIHLTDLNAVQGDYSQCELIAQLVRETSVPVQVAGGLRNRTQIQYWIDHGAARLVVSTLAVREPALLSDLARAFPGKIVISVDVWQGKVMMDGWRSASTWAPEALMQAFDPLPLGGFIVTDIGSDVLGIETELDLVASLAPKVATPVIAGGVVRTLENILQLRSFANVAGALLGTALLQQHIDLVSAMGVARVDMVGRRDDRGLYRRVAACQ